jgi:hypothetical protein
LPNPLPIPALIDAAPRPGDATLMQEMRNWLKTLESVWWVVSVGRNPGVYLGL